MGMKYDLRFSVLHLIEESGMKVDDFVKDLIKTQDPGVAESQIRKLIYNQPKHINRQFLAAVVNYFDTTADAVLVRCPAGDNKLTVAMEKREIKRQTQGVGPDSWKVAVPFKTDPSFKKFLEEESKKRGFENVSELIVNVLDNSSGKANVASKYKGPALIGFKMTKEGRDKLAKEAKKQGVAVSEFIRRRLEANLVTKETSIE